MGACGCMHPKPNCQACGNYIWPDHQPYRTGYAGLPNFGVQTLGCVCPPTSEQTCMNEYCPRKSKLKDQNNER